MITPILPKIRKLFIIFVLVVLSYFLLTATLDYSLPIIAAIFIALCMEPGVTFLVKALRFPRPFASIVILVLIVFSIIALSIVLITELYEGITYLAEKLPSQLQAFGALLDHYFHVIFIPLYKDVLHLFNQLAPSEQMAIQQYMTEIFNQIATLIGSLSQDILLSIPDTITKLPQSFTMFIFIFIASLIISADFPNLKELAVSIAPRIIHEHWENLMSYFKKAMTGYVKAQLILVLISFFIILSGFLILRIDHAFTIAIFMLLIDLVPYVGTGLLFLPWILYCFLIGNYPQTIGLAIIYAVVILTRQLIEPKILSINMGIHPLAWLVAVFFGFKIWGVMGLLVAPFILVFIKSMQQANVFHLLYRYIFK